MPLNRAKTGLLGLPGSPRDAQTASDKSSVSTSSWILVIRVLGDGAIVLENRFLKYFSSMGSALASDRCTNTFGVALIDESNCIAGLPEVPLNATSKELVPAGGLNSCIRAPIMSPIKVPLAISYLRNSVCCVS